jgi:hypothetical protein
MAYSPALSLQHGIVMLIAGCTATEEHKGVVADVRKLV